MSDMKRFARLKDVENTQVHLRLPRNDYEFIKRMALAENTSINQAMLNIVQRMRKYLTQGTNIVP